MGWVGFSTVAFSRVTKVLIFSDQPPASPRLPLCLRYWPPWLIPGRENIKFYCETPGLDCPWPGPK